MPKIHPVQSSGVTKTILLLSGWVVAGWLLIAPRIEPISISLAPPSDSEAQMPGSTGNAGNSMEEIFTRWAEDPALGGALIGLCVLRPDGEPFYLSSLAERALCPASALKTVTTAAALDLLGPDFRFQTSLAGTAGIGADGVLRGDLLLAGGGDPTLSSADLDLLVAAALEKGLKQVTGRMLVDASAFPPQAVSDHWNWGDIGNAYGAGAYGVNVDHNRMELAFDPGAKRGDPATLLPGAMATRDTRWINRVTTGPEGSGDQVVVYSQPYGRSVTLQGTVPLGQPAFTITGALPDPPAYAAEYLAAAFAKAGVLISQTVNTPSQAREIIATHRSAPLPEIIDHLHRVSDNLEAQCLFLTMGRREKKDPAEALERYWEKQGVFFKGLRLIDGSGLARATMIRPVDLARINHIARHGPQGERYRASLSAYLDGRVRAKLGAMSGVKTETGFLTTPDGRELTYALMANGLDPALDYWPLRTRLLEELAR